LPHVPEDYVHRIGRTARAGQKGHAISLVCIDEQKLLRDIEDLLGCEIEKQVLRGYEPDSRIKAEPICTGRAQRKSNRGSRSRKPSSQRRRRAG